MRVESQIRFHLGDAEHSVNPNDVTPATTLNSYLREKLHLTATKKMCLEGGCGTCIVAVEEIDDDGNKNVFAVNSCLVSIFSCHGWKIITNEGIGDPIHGFHNIQKILADNNGSQCGFCSSGMVMNMYALTKSGKKLTEAEIENSFAGNLCRCTGYRPILTAFKKLAIDAESDITDVEDLKISCDKSKCQNGCLKPCKNQPISIEYNQGKSQWMKVYNLDDLLEILRTSGNKKYMLVAGNTARGVFWPIDDYTADLYIEVTAVVELTSYNSTPDSLVLGGNTTLASAMQIFRKVAKSYSQFVYLDKMADHLNLVAHIPVRNIGTLAGNLMMKHKHNEFPSDVFLILETANAVLIIVDVDKNETRVSPENFLKVNMQKKVLKQIILPSYKSPANDTFNYTSYKIMPRAQNAHALVNAGFFFKLSPKGDVQSARIVYGAINPTFVHASRTENFLQGKNLFDNRVLQVAYKLLDQEIDPDWVLPDPSPKFRKQLAISLFYKGVLSIAPTFKVSARNSSGATLLNRPVSTGTQKIWSDQKLYPLTQPIKKIEALAQTSGKAEYILDKPDLPDQLHAVLVKAQSIPGSVITDIDPTKALKAPGVVAFFSAKDIPGVNSIHVASLWHMAVVEEIFCSGTVQRYSQPIGLLVATSHEIALKSRALIKVTVTPPTAKPVFKAKEVVDNNMSERITHLTSFLPRSKGSDIQRVIKGESYMNTQYHFHMENQNCLVIPIEDGLDVYAGTQWMDHTQAVISQALKLPSQKINMFVRRLGGGFGAKMTRSPFCSAPVALAAWKLQKPVRLWMSISDNMDIMGKRFPLYTKYEVGVNAKGVIQYLEANLYRNLGVGGNEPNNVLIPDFINCYNSDTWTVDYYNVKTDLPAFCYTRAPGSFESIGAIESIMDQIACELRLDPLDVRKSNMNVKDNPILVDFFNDMVKNDEIFQRRRAVELYNKNNRWKKRGMSFVPMRFFLEFDSNYTTLVSIYHSDGGVAISHGGIEMGQGIDTKVAQVAAYKLGIPIDKISVKPSCNVIAANAMATAASKTSESVVYSLLKACDVLLERIKPIRDQNPNATWEQLIALCYANQINLTSFGYFASNLPGIDSYDIFGCCVMEVEVDILTGKHEILRTDILEDVGQSMSPLIDIGQLEGAFIMGLGCHSTEEIVIDQTTGELMNNRTWNYKPLGAKDIPQDFRIRFANNNFNPVGVLNSKAVAEPAVCLSIAFPLAVRNALASARAESGSTDLWYPVDGPSTVENTLLNTLNDYKLFVL